jgi:hypothetical protein
LLEFLGRQTFLVLDFVDLGPPADRFVAGVREKDNRVFDSFAQFFKAIV